ncbi:cupin domain-containing protein [Nonomuraea sp. CA-143628]|uniref:cupin domain-containing protein n=1 Tax=Nonomuraea sp. CA-143628 TaxID=3239997 RepID=UPI003D92B941
MADKVIARKPGEGDAFWVLGGLYEIKAASDETGGGVTVIEMTVPAGMGPPPHTHPGTEMLYILEGTVRVYIDDEVVEGGPGSFFYIPDRTWERFEPLTDARILVTYAPGGIEGFFAEIGELAPTRQAPPADHPLPSLKAVTQVGLRYGLEMRLPE